MIGRDIPEPFAGPAVKDVDALDVIVGNGNAGAIGVEGEPATIQVEVDGELGDGFALLEVPGSDRSVAPEGDERAVRRALDAINNGPVAIERFRQPFPRFQVVEA